MPAGIEITASATADTATTTHRQKPLMAEVSCDPDMNDVPVLPRA